MGEVVEFKAIRRASLSATLEGSARILFFTGVRYVRPALETEPPGAICSVRRSGRNRLVSGPRGKRTRPSSRN
jgi:hypothetical protein